MSTTEELNGAALARFMPKRRGVDLGALAELPSIERPAPPAASLSLAERIEVAQHPVALTVAYRLIAALALVIAAPVVLLICLGIFLNSPGNPIFKQRRIGLGGEAFTLYKFRTMHPDAEHRRHLLHHLNEMDEVLFKVRRDPRVFWFGRLLRRLSLDEVPQLWNVVKGEMSIVGPRPALPSEVEQYSERERQRLLVPPGLTGLWQISGRSDLPWSKAIELDLQYVEERSALLDLKIVAGTLPSVLSGRGAY